MNNKSNRDEVEKFAFHELTKNRDSMKKALPKKLTRTPTKHEMMIMEFGFLSGAARCAEDLLEADYRLRIAEN